MSNIRDKHHIFLGAWHVIQRLWSDILFLFKSRKLFIYSWLKYDGAKMLHNNWGDDINILFFESISQMHIKDLSPSYFYKLFPIKGYSCIGSVLGTFNASNYEVWGSGITNGNRPIKTLPSKVYSVRGPKTRQTLLNRGVECPEIYGDPALLVSRYYRKLVEKRYLYGIIPHYTDEKNPVLQEFCSTHPEYIVIKMHGYDDWHDIPDQIMQCRRIISSSLHGLIIADSYGIPNVWVRFSGNITGGEFKYQDYFQSVGRNIEAPFYIETMHDLERIIIDDVTSLAYNIDYRAIFESCPFKDRLIDYKKLTPKLSQYQSMQAKEEHYSLTYYVKTEFELDKILRELETTESGLLFRGVNDARFKMFASSQRHWLQKTDRILPLGTTNYYQAIEMLIALTRKCEEVKKYLQKENHTDNDMYLLALMQHFGVPSPMIDFSQSMLKGLFFAVDGMSHWEDKGTDDLNDYVSLYFISKSIDWVSGSVQKMMERAGETIEYMLEDLKVEEPEVKVDTKETLAEIKELSYRQFEPTGDNYDIDFIPLNGAEVGITSVNIPSLKFSCSYLITNDRILAQDGLFIMNNTLDQPLVEVVNRKSHNKFFCCLNIRKNLVPYIIRNYLLPNNLTHEYVYCEDDKDVMALQQAMDRI